MTDKVAAEGLIASHVSQLELTCPQCKLTTSRRTSTNNGFCGGCGCIFGRSDSVTFSQEEIAALRADVSSPATPQLAKIALADDIIEQVQRRYAGSGPLPTKGSTTVYADAQMVLAALAEGAVSAAPLGVEKETKD